MNVNEALLDAVSELQVEADKVFPPSPRTAVVSRDDARYSNLRRKINNVCAIAATTGKATGEALDNGENEALCDQAAMRQWNASLKRPDLSEKDRVRGAIEAFKRQAVAIQMLAAQPAQGAEAVRVTEAAQRIFETMCGRPVDWAKHAADLNEDNLFQSADWECCLRYARAALDKPSPAAGPASEGVE